MPLRWKRIENDEAEESKINRKIKKSDAELRIARNKAELTKAETGLLIVQSCKDELTRQQILKSITLDEVKALAQTHQPIK
jgi:TnpA family transposase